MQDHPVCTARGGNGLGRRAASEPLRDSTAPTPGGATLAGGRRSGAASIVALAGRCTPSTPDATLLLLAAAAPGGASREWRVRERSLPPAEACSSRSRPAGASASSERQDATPLLARRLVGSDTAAFPDGPAVNLRGAAAAHADGPVALLLPAKPPGTLLGRAPPAAVPADAAVQPGAFPAAPGSPPGMLWRVPACRGATCLAPTLVPPPLTPLPPKLLQRSKSSAGMVASNRKPPSAMASAGAGAERRVTARSRNNSASGVSCAAFEL
jgi:hypothetical protein